MNMATHKGLSMATPSRLRKFARRRAFGLSALVLAVAGAALIGDAVYIKAKAEVAQVLMDRAWTRTLAGQAEAKPWSWADTWPVAKLEVPRLQETSIVLDGVSGQAMAFGPGLMHGPKPGEAGLAVISAHRDTHFRFLKNIKLGDEVYITNADGTQSRFKISETRIVEADASGLYQSADEAQIALVTCWPFDALRQGSKRFVALGKALPMET